MNLLETVFNLVAPHDCLICGREGSLLCAWCAPEVLTPVSSACVGCGAPTLDFAVCPKCHQGIPLQHAWHTAIYEKTAKDLVYALKFQQKRAAATTMASHMHEVLPYFENTLVVPIPTAASRVRERGFDHAILLAKQFAQYRKLPYQPVLARFGSSRQVGQTKQVRAKQLGGMFRIRKPQSVTGKTILLVDDVATTGATLAEAARTLRCCGAKTINAAVFAVSKFQ